MPTEKKWEWSAWFSLKGKSWFLTSWGFLLLYETLSQFFIYHLWMSIEITLSKVLVKWAVIHLTVDVFLQRINNRCLSVYGSPIYYICLTSIHNMLWYCTTRVAVDWYNGTIINVYSVSFLLLFREVSASILHAFKLLRSTGQQF